MRHSILPTHYPMESEEEALFRSYPYYVQSPSPSSHANTYEMTYHSPPQSENNNVATTHAALSPYSSRGSIISLEKEGGATASSKLENGKSGGVILENGGGEKKGEVDEDCGGEYYYSEGALWKYLSFSYSNSGWWIWLQLGWRLVFSFVIALLVFYVLAGPPAPGVTIKVARIRQFKLGEGVDVFGVPTKVLNCNATIDLIIDNKSKIFDLHIHPPTVAMSFRHVPFASSQGGELSAGSDDTTLFKLRIGTINKPMYGAGRSMQDLLESGKGLPLVVTVGFRSSFHVVWGFIEPKYHHEARCLVLLGNTFEKRNRTQVFSSKCLVSS